MAWTKLDQERASSSCLKVLVTIVVRSLLGKPTEAQTGSRDRLSEHFTSRRFASTNLVQSKAESLPMLSGDMTQLSTMIADEDHVETKEFGARSGIADLVSARIGQAVCRFPLRIAGVAAG